MSRTRRWLVIGLAVALAAFISGLVRGLSDTSPFEVDPSPSVSTTEG